MTQLLLDFAPKKPEPEVEVEPEPEVEPEVVEAPKSVDSPGHLRWLVQTGEFLIYFYGENPSLCFIRTHSSDDTEVLFPIMRNEAMSIIGREYVYHCNHISYKGKKARVYLKRRTG